MSLSFFFTKAGAVKTARWATVPAIAAGAVALAAGPALAAGSHARVSTTSAVVSHGQVTVNGRYQCAWRSRSEELQVSVSSADRRGRAEATREVRVNCNGSLQTWRLTFASNHRGQQFSPGAVRVDATLWSPQNRYDRASSSRTLIARWI
ncbi:DUF6299 family protein [Actinospica robiniae]|uniref:DUF6299 family protein n=1 Tax=Actinospica robiniae TaxID=304901 RepID=UPI0004072954|nr:DUF6299 family protein [Actinospica robiniae]